MNRTQKIIAIATLLVLALSLFAGLRKRWSYGQRVTDPLRTSLDAGAIIATGGAAILFSVIRRKPH